MYQIRCRLRRIRQNRRFDEFVGDYCLAKAETLGRARAMLSAIMQHASADRAYPLPIGRHGDSWQWCNWANAAARLELPGAAPGVMLYLCPIEASATANAAQFQTAAA